MTWPASYKLWRVIKEPDGYYYELRVKDEILARVPIDVDKIDHLKEIGVMKNQENK